MGRFILKLAAYSFPSLFFSSANQLTAPCTRVWRYRIQLISLVQVQLLVKKKPEDKRQQSSVEDGVHGSQTLQMVHLPAVITWLLGDNKKTLEKKHRNKGEKEHMWLESSKVHVPDCLLLVVDFCLHFSNSRNVLIVSIVICYFNPCYVKQVRGLLKKDLF